MSPHHPAAGSTVITARDLLATTARVVGARVVPCVLVTASCTVPGTLLANAVSATIPRDAFNPVAIAAVVLHVVGVCLAQAALARIAIDHIANRRPRSAIDGLNTAVVRIVPVVSTVFFAALLTGLGLLLLVIPGIIVWLACFLVVPVAVVEHRGPFQSLERSAALTKGHRGVLLLAALAVGLVYVLFTCTGGTMFALERLVSERGAADGQPTAVRAALVATNLVGQWMLIVGLSTLSAVFYSRRRSIELAAVAEAHADQPPGMASSSAATSSPTILRR